MYIVFIGPPGAGKGTQARRLVSHLHIPHLSTGEMLRQAQTDGTKLGEEAAKYMNLGNLVPDDLILEIVEARLDLDDCQKGCLFDGFPRTVTQAVELDRYLLENARPLNAVIEMTLDRDEVMRRILKRAELEQREDDTMERVKQRLDVFEQQTRPLVDYYKAQGMLAQIDAVGSPDEVFNRILGSLENGAGNE